MHDQMLVALAQPHRLRIIELLRGESRSVNDIAHELRLNQPQTSKHLRILSQAGLVSVQPKAQQRLYSLEQARFAELGDWLQTFGRPAWDKRLDRLEKHVTK